MRTTDLAEMLRGLGKSNLQRLTEIISDSNDDDSDDIRSKQKKVTKKKTSTDDADNTNHAPDQVILNPLLYSIDNRR